MIICLDSSLTMNLFVVLSRKISDVHCDGIGRPASFISQIASRAEYRLLTSSSSVYNDVVSLLASPEQLSMRPNAAWRVQEGAVARERTKTLASVCTSDHLEADSLNSSSRFGAAGMGPSSRVESSRRQRGLTWPTWQTDLAGIAMPSSTVSE